jgi:hypothetical protein
MGWNSTSVEAAVGEVRYTEHIQHSIALGRLQKESRAIRIAVSLGLFVLTVWLDLSVDHDLSLFALYLIPTFFSAWYLGSRWACGSCLAGAAVWVIDEGPEFTTGKSEAMFCAIRPPASLRRTSKQKSLSSINIAVKVNCSTAC